MDPRDPKFTLRLEEALRRLAKNQSLAIAYLTHRHDLAPGELQLWLDTFNGGKKELLGARIDAVKVEVGLIKDGRASDAKPAAPHIEGEASAPSSKEAGPGKPVRGPAVECLRLLAENPGMSENAAAKKAGFASWTYFKKREFGPGPISPERIARFLHERCVHVSAPEAPDPKPPRSAERPAQKPAATRIPKPAAPPPESAGGTMPVRVVLRLEVAVRVLSATAEQ